MSEVVVVLPLLPVIQIFLALVKRPANSISEMILIPFFLIALMMGVLSGIPGLLIISSALSISRSVWLPDSWWIP